MLVSLLLFQLLFFTQPAVVDWLSPTTHDFGQLEQYEPESVAFQFQNTTDKPLLIDNVRTTCGCTAPDWKRGAILPDSTSTIQITYDARKRGKFRKRILVFFSAQRKAEQLFIEGEVR